MPLADEPTTTRCDVASGRSDPRSTRLGFHEGSHGPVYVEYFRNHPIPEFQARVGMTVADFRQASREWNAAMRAYEADVEETDQVGIPGDRAR
jgi:hypothetical protein